MANNIHAKFIEKIAERVNTLFSDPERYGYTDNFLDKETPLDVNDMLVGGLALNLAVHTYSKNKDDIEKNNFIGQDGRLTQEGVNFLAEKAIPLYEGEDSDKNLLQDKIISRNGYLQDTDSYAGIILPQEEEYRNQMLYALGFDPDKVFLRRGLEDGNHVTYNIAMGTDITGKPYKVSDIIKQGGPQTRHRKATKQTQTERHLELLDEIEEPSEEQKKEKNWLRRIVALEKSDNNLSQQLKKEGVIPLKLGTEMFKFSEKPTDTKSEERFGRVYGEVSSYINISNYRNSEFGAGLSGNALSNMLIAHMYSLTAHGRIMDDTESEAVAKSTIGHIFPTHHSAIEARMGVALANQIAKSDGFPDKLNINAETLQNMLETSFIEAGGTFSSLKKLGSKLPSFRAS